MRVQDVSSVDDMIRDKCVFSRQDLAEKESLLREDELTPEKAVSMERASKASKEQIKAIGIQQENNQNLSVNGIRSGDN